MSETREKTEAQRAAIDSDNSWLTRPATVRKLWWAFGIVLGLTVLAQVFIPVKGKFALDSTFAFGAWYGFGCCVLMVLAARVLGWWLKRPEDYYARAGIEPPPQEKEQEHKHD